MLKSQAQQTIKDKNGHLYQRESKKESERERAKKRVSERERELLGVCLCESAFYSEMYRYTAVNALRCWENVIGTISSDLQK